MLALSLSAIKYVANDVTKEVKQSWVGFLNYLTANGEKFRVDQVVVRKLQRLHLLCSIRAFAIEIIWMIFNILLLSRKDINVVGRGIRLRRF